MRGVNWRSLKKIVGQELNNQLKALSQKRNMIAHGEPIERFSHRNTEKASVTIMEKFVNKSSAFNLLQVNGIIPAKEIHNLGLSDIYSIQMYEFFEKVVVNFADKLLIYLKENNSSNERCHKLLNRVVNL